MLIVWVLNIWMCLSLNRKKAYFDRKKSANVRMEEYNNPRQSRLSTDISGISDVCNLSLSSTEFSKNEILCRKNKNKSIELLLMSTVRTVVIAFSIAIIPAMIVMALGIQPIFEPSSKYFKPTAKACWNSFAYISSRLIFANSFFNCFIYSYKCNRFREAVKALFCLCLQTKQKQMKSIKHNLANIYKLHEAKRNSVKSIQETI